MCQLNHCQILEHQSDGYHTWWTLSWCTDCAQMMLFDQQSVCFFFFRGICVLQLSKCSSVKSRLIDFCGAIFFAKDTVCTRGEFLFFPSSLPLDPSPLNPVSTPRGRTLRTASMESNPLKNAKAPWPRRHQMNPYRGGRGEGGKKKQFCRLSAIKAWQTPSPQLPAQPGLSVSKRLVFEWLRCGSSESVAMD